MNIDVSASNFLPASAPPPLRAGEVHVWSAWLDDSPSDACMLLSAAEWARAARFQFESDCDKYIASRALVRSILGAYTGAAAKDLHFESGLHGKPELAGSMLRFNLSHSGDLLLLAVTYGRELGIDVEEIRAGVSFEMLADHYFTAEAAWQLRLLSPEDRAANFYDIWTRTEAQLKANGSGLANGTQVADPGRWTVLSLTPAEGYASALAVEGGSFQLQCCSWQNPNGRPASAGPFFTDPRRAPKNSNLAAG
ncbi:MAG TPA: 4'-phosphopantetheinyl transferase superfamily protein [Chthoniobacteraceae bacterium]|jgi:4'-phosphopantetheinyl transferase